MLVERIAELERVKCAAAAGQARAAAALDAARRAAEAAAGMPAARRGRGIASEIALARRDSPARGNRHLGFAKALVHEMPHTLAALEAGALSEWRATLIVRESACLDVEDRRTLDAELCADSRNLDCMGDARLAAAAKTIAYRLDPHAVVDRAAKAETERCVNIRPAPDTMTYLTALLPVAQGVSVYAALRREADTCADGRSRGQVMADVLVERVTGHSDADRGEPGAVRRDFAGRLECAGRPVRLRSRSSGDRARIGVGRCRRRTVAGHDSPAVCASGHRCVGRDGVESQAVSPRIGGIHPIAGSALPNALLRRADPSSRPCSAVGRRRCDRCGQRTRTLRTL